MGLGSSEPKRIQYFLDMKATKDKKLNPHFKTSIRKDGATTAMTDETEVSGFLTKISHGKYEHPANSGKWVDTIQMFFIDGPNVFKVSTSVNTNLARGLMNKIISMTSWEWMKLSLYPDQKKENAQLSVRNNDELVKWKYEWWNAETQKGMKAMTWEVQNPTGKDGDMIRIYTKLNAFLLAEWTKMEPLVSQNAVSNKRVAAAIKEINGGVAPAAAEPSAEELEKQLFQGSDTARSQEAAADLKPEDLEIGDEPFNGGASSTDDLPF